MKPPKILLIDDDPNYCERLKQEASGEGFDLHYVHNLEEGIDRLKEEDFSGVILDSHCYVEENQKNPPGANFIIHAIDQLSELRIAHNRHLVICVNTAKPEEVKETFEGFGRVFAKGDSHPQLWKFLKEEIEKLPYTEIRQDFRNIFDNIHRIYPDNLEHELLELIDFQRRGSDADIPNKIGQVRRLLEYAIGKTYQELFRVDVEEILEQGRAGFASESLSKLKKAKIINNHLYDVLRLAYGFCSEHGSHPPMKPRKIPLNSTTLNYLVGALLVSIDNFLNILENKEEALIKVIEYLNNKSETKKNN